MNKPQHNKIQNLLICLIEESSEIQKILNNKQYIDFDGGFEEKHLLAETIDFIAVVDLLIKEDVIQNKNLIVDALSARDKIHHVYKFGDDEFNNQTHSVMSDLIDVIFQSCKVSRFDKDEWSNEEEMINANITLLASHISRVIKSILVSEISLDNPRIKTKQDKVLKYMKLSREKGVLI